VSYLWDKCGNLSIEMVQARLAAIREPARTFNPGISLRRAAVLVPLVCEGGALHLLFTRRTDLVHDHKGQVAFPGGSVEPQDASLEDTALRETFEEIGIPPSEIRVLGKLPLFPTITGFIISPVVGMVPWPYDLRLSPEEVSRVFTIPLAWLADPANRVEKPMTLPDGRNERVVFFNNFDGENLWGATARITLNFLRTLELV
jgi:8-oxo-dGTP pyrophosphatase MutT (NUDIX family)